MEWKRCSGTDMPAIRSEVDGGKAMCPVCTKYVPVKIGQLTPRHEAVVIQSRENYPLPHFGATLQ